MLIKFSVKNFRSFKDEVSLDMTKLLRNSVNNHPSHVNKNKVGGFETLKSAVIYGANASGKSNLIKTLTFFTGWVSGKYKVDSRITFGNDSKLSDKFLLDNNYVNDQPSCFSIEFNTDKKSYCYYVEILDGLIINEYLNQISTSEDDKIIFCRKYDSKSKNYSFVKIGGSYEEEVDLEKIRYALEISDGSNPILIQLLKYNFSQEIKESDFFKDILDAFFWLRNDVISYKDGESSGEIFELMDGNSDFKDFLLDLVQKYDLGSIYDIANDELSDKEKDNLYVRIPPLKGLISNFIEQETKSAFVSSGQERYLLNKKDDKTVAIKSIKLVRKNNNNQEVAFDFVRESQGTVKLIDLAMFFYQGFSINKTILVDELENSLHPLIIMDLVDNILNNGEIDNVQFVVTTHSECLFDLSILRRDEIWLMNKNNDGSSYLNSLADFKDKNNKSIRYDKEILKDYLIGRYRGIPRI